MFTTFLSRFAAVTLVASGLCLSALPVRAQNAPMGGAQAGAARQNPLLKGITLSPAQKTQYQAIETKYKTETQQMQQKLIAKYNPQMMAIQQGAGTDVEKKAKAKPIAKKMFAEIGPATKAMLGRMTTEVGNIMTAAQKPAFNKNKAALMAQVDAGLKAAAAQVQ